MVDWNDETEQRALSLLQSPMGALQFADAFWPEKSSRSVGSRSLSGHVTLRRLESLGLVTRTRGATPALDQFVAVDATSASPLAPPPQPPELHVQPDGQVVAVERRTVGKLASETAPTPASPMQPAELYVAANGEVLEVQRRSLGRVAAVPERAASGELVVDASGNVVRITKEVIGRAQLPPPPQAPAAQSTQQPSAALALSMLIFGLKFAPPIDPIVRRQKLSEVFVLISQIPQVPSWLRQQYDLLWQRETQAPAAAPVVPPPPAQQPMQAVPTMQQMLQTFELLLEMQKFAQAQARRPV